jgi:dipeptidyl aminopeptidase/acylaminoacyl peptidase
MEAATEAKTRFTFNPANDWQPVWSRDGAFIAFASDRNAKSSIYRKAVSGTGEEEEELLVPPQSEGGVFLRDWSPDGRFILYTYTLDQGGQSLWLSPVAGDRKPIPLLATSEFLNAEGRFSPDGKWVAYVSSESGAAEVYVKPVAIPGKIRVSSNCGSFPRWRHDGKEIFYMAPGGNLMAAAVRGGEKFEAGPPKPLFGHAAPTLSCGRARSITTFRPTATASLWFARRPRRTNARSQYPSIGWRRCLARNRMPGRPITRLSRAASTTVLVTCCSALISRIR